MKEKEDIQVKPEAENVKINKKLVWFIAGIILVIFLSVIIYAGQSNLQNNQITSTPTGISDQSNTQTDKLENRKFNPLVNPQEVDRVESALRKKMEASGETISPMPKYKFKYKLDPGLSSNKSTMLIKAVYSANKCNIDLAPDTLPVYTLKDHLNIEDAKSIAKEYSINSDPSGSLPSIDGTSFDYFFSDSVISQFLKISEASGVSHWHRVVQVDPTADIGATQAQTIIQTELGKHNLLDRAVLKKSGIDGATNHYVSRYEKNYDNLIMTDKYTILALGTSSSVCTVGQTTLMNYIEADVTKNGYFQKLMNKTRKIVESSNVKRATLEDSMNEYQDNPPVEPIVIGSPATTSEITIDEAVLVWYDYGEMIPQIAYVPMYLTSGKTSDGARVFTLFPAVTLEELEGTEMPELSASRDTLQLYTFNPPPPNKPPAPKSPLSGTPFPTVPGVSGTPVCDPNGTSTGGISTGGLGISMGGLISSGGMGGSCSTGPLLGSPGSATNKCWGGAIDYTVKCTDSAGFLVCNNYNEIDTDDSGKNDPFEVCKNGCQTKNATLNLPSGSDPCNEYLKQNNLTPKMPGLNSSPNYKGGPVECQLQGCPC